ncbi:MAG: CRISPR-associated protein Cas4 [Bacillota bacterium]|jgi:CRISPR-associated exonuclease Cas4
MKKCDNLERLPISAIKQYAYCRRRFGLMFIDKEWADNYKIVEGEFLHAKVDDPFFSEKRGDIYVSRSVPVYSDKDNLYGIADIIEFIKDDDGVEIGTKKGLWSINPIEYKNGKPEKSNADALQLLAVAICLEKMFKIHLEQGDIYYGRLRRRKRVVFDAELRERLKEILAGIKHILDTQQIPEKTPDQNCSLCSLVNICLPEIFHKKQITRDRINNLLVRGGR